MYPYIVCFCGRSLGDIYDVYKQMRLNKYKKEYGEAASTMDPHLMTLSNVAEVVVDDILNKLHLKTICCRARMISQVEFKEYY